MRRSIDPGGRIGALGALLAALALAPASAPTADHRAADAQYRVARRLVADRSPEAGAALARVVALDPSGPLADDALVEHAALLGAPEWPEALGRLDEDRARQARALLDEAVRTHPAGDRAAEARYRSALLRLEPLPGRDAKRARLDLLALATSGDGGDWGARARYAIGVIDASHGEDERARGALARVVIDRPAGEAAARAQVGLSVLAARAGEFGRAAADLQRAIDGNVPVDLRAAVLREGAVRALLRPAMARARWGSAPATRTVVGAPKGVTAMALGPDGALLVADRKTGAVSILDAQGGSVARWAIDDVRAVAFDPYGGAYGAADGRVVRFGPGGPQPVASLADFASPRALAVDASGSVWVLDKKGSRLGRIVPGARVPEIVTTLDGARWSALGFDGRVILASEERTGRIVAVRPDGGTSAVAAGVGTGLVSLATDAFGQIAALDEDGGTVILLGPGGDVRERFDLRAAGVDRPWAAGLGADGTLVVLDGSAGAVLRFP